MLVLLACLLTWRLPEKSDIRHALIYGYLNILHVPIYLYICWTGQFEEVIIELKEDGSIGLLTDTEPHVDDGVETTDESGSAPA